MNPGVVKAIQYPNAVYDEDEQRWVSDAEVAEVSFVAFTGRRKAEKKHCGAGWWCDESNGLFRVPVGGERRAGVSVAAG